MFTFTFNGKNSYSDMKILAKRIALPMPERKITFVDIPGRNGSLTFDDNAYKDITLPAIQCALVDDSTFTTSLDAIKAWLATSDYKQLILSTEADKYMNAIMVTKVDISEAIKNFGEFALIFRCKPFKYLASPGSPISVVASTQYVLNNLGNVYSEPIIRVNGTGTGTVIVNGKTITLTNISGHIILDSVRQDAYNDNGDNLNAKMTGDFPTFIPGNNEITKHSAFTSLSITPNMRWL